LITLILTHHPLQLLKRTLEAFQYQCFGFQPSERPVSFAPVKELVQANLADPAARHLMLLTRNGAALPVMFACGLLSEADTMVRARGMTLVHVLRVLWR
jgi:hypothetical protein